MLIINIQFTNFEVAHHKFMWNRTHDTKMSKRCKDLNDWDKFKHVDRAYKV